MDKEKQKSRENAVSEIGSGMGAGRKRQRGERQERKEV